MKRTVTVLAVAGAGWISYQIHHAFHHFYNIIPKDVIDLEQKLPEYIQFQPNFTGRAQIEAFWLPQYIWWWKSVPSSVAWRLLRTAQHGNRKDRRKAVHSLALLENLDDSDCYQLAQACDSRTAVGLARTEGVDLRLFLKCPKYPCPIKKEDLIDSCHEMLLALNNKAAHECVQYFVAEVLSDIQDRNMHYSSRINKEYILTLCLKSILHHSNVPDHSDEIIRLGGLKLLMDVYYHYSESADIVSIIAKIIANISQPQYANKMMLSGWIGVLAKWMSSPYIQVKSPAAKALANLDVDDHIFSYKGGVYLLHPLHRDHVGRNGNIKADVIFVHGLLGGVFWTWRLRDKVKINFSKAEDDNISELNVIDNKNALDAMFCKVYDKISQLASMNNLLGLRRPVQTDCPINSRRERDEKYLDMSGCGSNKDCLCPEKDITKCWPIDWLPKDLPSLRVIGLNYDTYISLWMPVCPEETLHTSLEERSSEFIKKLKEAGIGRRPIIWVAHSMGGLIVKNMLVKALESEDKEIQKICRNTKGIVFYSVPHLGSHIASLKQATKMLLLPSNEVKELRYNSPELLDMHKRFLNVVKKFPVEVLSFAETEETLIGSLRFRYKLVAADSADPGVGEFYEIPSDHLNICKPSSRKSFLYQKFLVFTEKILKSI